MRKPCGILRWGNTQSLVQFLLEVVPEAETEMEEESEEEDVTDTDDGESSQKPR